MLQRVMPSLMGLKDILVLNDEAHHCYREKSGNQTKRTSMAMTSRKPKATAKPPASGSRALRSSDAS